MLASQPIKILTLWQLWASLIALGLKQYEPRSWSASYRGQLTTHAAKRPVVDVEVESIYDSVQEQSDDPQLIEQLDKGLKDLTDETALHAIAQGVRP